MKKQLVILVINIFLSGFFAGKLQAANTDTLLSQTGEPTNLSGDKPETKSGNPDKPGRQLPDHNDLQGAWTFFQLKELNEQTGQTTGTFYTHSSYLFEANSQISIDGSPYNWNMAAETGHILIAGTDFEIQFFEAGKLILRDGNQLFYLRKQTN